MRQELVDIALALYTKPDPVLAPSQTDARLPTIEPVGLKRANNRALAYTVHNRSQFVRPEFDFDEIQIAETVDSFLFRAIQKKTNRFITAGWEFVGDNPETVDYIKRRFSEIERVSNRPFRQLMTETVRDMFRYSNCMWVKVRNPEASSGERRRDYRGVKVDPVAGYFILPMETLLFKSKDNGDLLWVEQRLPGGDRKRFHATDLVHFYTNRNPGYSVGTPEIFPALDDIALLRRMEENIEELLESALFPFIHYKIGSDEFPERYTESGVKESDVVRTKMEYLPSGGIWISDHRHEITAMGAEGRALRAEPYLKYFKQRVFAAIGISPVDVGEGDSANRSTADTMSKSMMMDLEAMQEVIRCFVEFFVVDELLMEGGYNPTKQEEKVSVRFGVIDKQQRMALENQVIQLWNSNLYTHEESRAALGKRDFREDDIERTFFSMFKEPTALGKGMQPGSVQAHTLAGHPASNVSTETVGKAETFAKSLAASSKPAGGGSTSTRSGRPNSRSASANASTNKAKPANQHGSRASAKLNRDVLENPSNPDEVCAISIPEGIDADSLLAWKQLVHNKWESLASTGVSFDIVVESLLYRLKDQA